MMVLKLDIRILDVFFLFDCVTDWQYFAISVSEALVRLYLKFKAAKTAIVGMMTTP